MASEREGECGAGRHRRLAIPAPEFNEQAYLKSNPDVAARVDATPGMSGWRYFVEQGYLENRTGAPRSLYEEVRRQKNYEVDQILPPAFLRKRIHGADDVASFEQAGRAIASTSSSASRASRLLDPIFGCSISASDARGS